MIKIHSNTKFHGIPHHARSTEPNFGAYKQPNMIYDIRIELKDTRTEWQCIGNDLSE